VYNVGGGASISAKAVLAAVEAAVPGAALPDELRQSSAGEGEMSDGYMDISRARDEFGAAPRYDINSGIRQYADWLREHEL
jgi:nucleoside-diphosphate-sugar epimerase